METGITNMGQLDKQMAGIEKELLNIAKQLGGGDDYMRALDKAADYLVKAMQEKAPVANRTLYRYKNGKRVASYSPGNLKRSIKKLEHFRSKKAVFVGPEIMPRGKGKSDFSGSKVDGWYAQFVERRVPFIRPAAIESGPKAIDEMREFVKKVIRKSGGS